MASAFSELRAELTLDSSDFESGIAGAQSKMSGFRSAAGAAGLATAGAGALGMAAAAKQASEFETAMADVEKVTSKQTASQLKEEFMGLAETIPISQQELATLGEQAGKFGVKGTKNISKFVETVGQISSATSMTAEEAGTRFAKIAGAIGLPMSDIDKLGNATNSLADNFKTDANEITDTMTRAGITLSQRLGLSQEQALGLAASMNEVSPSSQLAASGLKQAAEALMDPKKVGKIASALGMTKGEFVNLRNSNPQKAFNLVSRAMAKGGKRATELAMAVGKRPTRAFSALGQQIGRTNSATKTASQQFKNGTSLAKEMGIRTNTTAGQWQLFQNSVRNAAIQTGDRLLPAIKSVLGVMTGLVQGFSKVNSATNGMAGVIAGLGAVFGGLGVAAAAFWPIIHTAATTITTVFIPALTGGAGAAGLLATAIGVLTSPITLAIGAIAAFGYAYSKNLLGVKTITDSVISGVIGTLQTLASWLGPKITAGITAVKSAFQQLGQFFAPVVAQIRSELSIMQSVIGIWADVFREEWTKTWAVIGPAVTKAVGMAQTALAKLGAVLQPLASWFTSSIVPALTTFVNIIGQQVSTAVTAGLQAVKLFLQLLRGDWSAAFQTAEDIVRNVFGNIKTTIQMAVQGFGPLLRSGLAALQTVLRTGITAAWNWLKGPGVALAKQAMGALARGAVAAFRFGKNNLLPAIQQAITFAWNWVKGPGVQLGKQALSLLAKGAVAAFRFGKNNLLPAIQSALRGAWNWVKTSGVSLARQALTFLGRAAIAATRTALSGLAQIVTAAITKAVGPQNIAKIRAFVQRVSQAWTSLKTGVVQAWNAVKTAVRSGVTAVMNIIRPFAQQINGAWQRIVIEARTTWNAWKQAITNAVRTLKGAIMPPIRSVAQFVTTTWSGLVTSARRIWTNLKTAVANAVRGIVAPIRQHFTTAKNTATQTARATVAPVRQAWMQIKRAIVTTARQLAVPVRSAFNTIRTVITGVIRTIQSVVRNGFNVIKRVATGAIRTIGSVIRGGVRVWQTVFRSNFRAMRGVAQTAWNAIKSVIGAAIAGIKAVVIAGLRVLRGDWQGALRIIQQTTRSIWNGIKRFITSAMRGIQQSVSQNWAAIKRAVTQSLNEIKRTATRAWRDIKSNITRALSNIKQTAVSEWNSIKRSITQTLNSIEQTATQIWKSIKQTITQSVNAIKREAVNKFNELKTKAAGAIESLKSEVVGKFESIKSEAVSKVNSAAQSIWQRFHKLKTDVTNTIKNLVSGVVNAFSGLGRKLKKKVTAATNAAKKPFEKLYNDVTGNSIIPDMVDDIHDEMDRMDMASPAAREMNRVSAVAKDHASTMASVLGDEYQSEIGVSGRASAAVSPASLSTAGSGQSTTGSQHVDVTISVEGDDELTRLIRENARVEVDEGIGELQKDVEARMNK